MKKKVFLIDDDEMICALMGALIKDVSWLDFSAKSSPEDALEYLDKSHFVPDLILVDLRMPEMSGLEALCRLKKLPGLSTTRLSLFSTAVDPESIKRAEEMGASYIVKDYDLLLANIRRVLG